MPPKEDYSNVQSYLVPDQTAKQDFNKPRLTLVPMQIVWDIAKVREYAVQHKYHDKNNWKQVAPERLIDAMIRHVFRFIEDPYGLDEETGLPHLYHIETNAAFLSVLMKPRFDLRMGEENKADVVIHES